MRAVESCRHITINKTTSAEPFVNSNLSSGKSQITAIKITVGKSQDTPQDRSDYSYKYQIRMHFTRGDKTSRAEIAPQR